MKRILKNLYHILKRIFHFNQDNENGNGNQDDKGWGIQGIDMFY